MPPPDKHGPPRDVVLSADSLVKRFGRRTVVKGVSLDLARGEITGLLGANGTGKTTTFSMIVGLLRPNAGVIRFEGRDITRVPMYRRARSGIAYLEQEPSVFRELTARENLLAVLEFKKLSKVECSKRADELLEELDIAHLADAKTYSLSGGERRRVEICRALSTDPKVFLLDEPFAGIDPIAVADLQEILKGLRRRGIGILITDHNVREMLQITDRAYILSEGQIIASGTPHEIAQDSKAREAYLGESFRLDFHDASI